MEPEQIIIFYFYTFYERRKHGILSGDNLADKKHNGAWHKKKS